MLTLIDGTGARHDALTAELSMGIRGNWVARVELGEAAPPAGALTLELERDGGPGAGVDAFVGTLRYGGDWQGRSEALVVGGAGGLLTDLPARHYAPKAHTVAAAVLVEDLAREAGETLDPSSSAPGVVGQWTRVAAPPTRALGLLCDRLGLQWRILASGALWVGEETWPEATVADTGYQTQERPEARALELRPDRATLRPGMSVLGRQVARVVYKLGAGGVSATAYYGPSDRQEFADAVAGLLPDPAYGHSYGAKVVAQNDDGTLELLVDDARVAELRRIPLRGGLVGCRSVVAAGERVRVSFENGDPDGAYAHGFDAPPAGQAHRGIARLNDEVSCGHFKVAGGALVRTGPDDPDGVELTGAITKASEEALIR